MTWNPPSNVSTGNALTAALWNNLLGTNGSLKFLYDPIDLVIIRQTPTPAIATNSSALVSWDYVFGNRGFSLPSLPFTSFTVPSTGMYLYTFTYLMNVSTNLRIRPQDTWSSYIHWADVPTSAFVNTISGHMYLLAGETISWRLFVTTSSTLMGYNADGSAILRLAKLSTW